MLIFFAKSVMKLKSEVDSVLKSSFYFSSSFFFFFKEHAFESSQKYKEGKFIIELAHMIKDNGWE